LIQGESLSERPAVDGVRILLGAGVEVVCFEISGRQASNLRLLAFSQAYRQRLDDAPDHLVLQHEYLGVVAVEALGPDVAFCFGVDELDVDADRISVPANTSLDHIVDIQLLRDLPDVDGSILERE